MRQLPLLLTALRAALAPVMVALALFHPDRLAFGLCLSVAFLSDVFDGILARRLGVATPSLRRLDSVADSIFYVAATFAAWHLHPAVIREHAAALLVLLAIELLRYAVDFWKFRREASYHMWSSKVWGLALFAGFLSLLAFDRAEPGVSIAIGWGLLADLEGLLISQLLPRWQSDVPSAWHAVRIRAADRKSRSGVD